MPSRRQLAVDEVETVLTPEPLAIDHEEGRAEQIPRTIRA